MKTIIKKHSTLVGFVGIIVILVGVGLFFLPQYLYQGGICAFCGLILFIIAVINHEVEVPTAAKVAKPSQADIAKQNCFKLILMLVTLCFLIPGFLIPDTLEYLVLDYTLLLVCIVWFVLFWEQADHIDPIDVDLGMFVRIELRVFIIIFVCMLVTLS